jgi:hypothetical protein
MSRLAQLWKRRSVRVTVYIVAACLLVLIGGFKPPTFIYQEF